jgi:FkbM family methyltransferase
LNNDYYGEGFWEKINEKIWEPDTFDFVRSFCDASTHFLDIGAANGAISLAAALSGASVTAYEPDPIIFSVLKRNIELNPNIQNLIKLNHAGVSSESGNLNFESLSDPEIFSNILFRNKLPQMCEVEIKSLHEELARYGISKKKIVIKMDIEGAEYKILNDIQSLQALSKFDSLLLLAIHPGFNRTYRKSKIHKKISEKIWRQKNLHESMTTFSELQKFH